MKHLYLDVTHTASATQHTGIQRIVRSLWQYRSYFQAPVIPIVWRGPSTGFCQPGAMEMKRLDKYFSRGWHRVRWVARLSRKMDGWRIRAGVEKELDFSQLLGEESVFLLPEVFSDDRMEFFQSNRFGRVRTLAVCHDVFSWSHPEWTALERKAGFASYLKLLSQMELVICPSHYTEQELRRFWKQAGLKDAKIVVTPWPCDFCNEVSVYPKKKKLPLVLSVGTLEPRKNHQMLLRVAERLWSEGLCFKLVLVGRPRSRKEREVLHKIESLRRSGYDIDWKSSVSDHFLHKLYAQAAFTAYLSLGEGFGLPIMESLAHGVPCLCSGKGAMGEISLGGGCEVVDVTSEDDTYRGWKQLLGQPEYRESLAVQAKNRQWPTWEETIGGWKRILAK